MTYDTQVYLPIIKPVAIDVIDVIFSVVTQDITMEMNFEIAW